MLLGQGIEPNDQLVVEVCKENRIWGYNPCPDGTLVTMVDHSEILYEPLAASQAGVKPGVYVNHDWLKVRFDDGREDVINTIHLTPTDREKYERKLKEWSQKRPEDPNYLLFVFVRDLPEAA